MSDKPANDNQEAAVDTPPEIAVDTIQVEDLDDLLSSVTTAVESEDAAVASVDAAESADDAFTIDDVPMPTSNDALIEDVSAKVDALSETVAALDAELQELSPDPADESKASEADAVADGVADADDLGAPAAVDGVETPAPANVADSPADDHSAPPVLSDADLHHAIDDLAAKPPPMSTDADLMDDADLVTDADLAVAEAEIDARLGSGDGDDASTAADASADVEVEAGEAAPSSRFARVVRAGTRYVGGAAAGALVLFDRPFANWSADRKAAIGLAAIATLGMSAVAWVLGWTVVS